MEMTCWEQRAMFLEKEYGVYVDWKNRYYVCPRCDCEVSEEDWEYDEYLTDLFEETLCPFCRWEGN